MAHRRREFLIHAAHSLMTAFALSPKALLAATVNQEESFLAIGDGHDEPAQGNPYRKTDSLPGAVLFLSAASLAEQKAEILRFKTPFRPHGTAQSPAQSQMFACFEKWGAHFAVINLSSEKGEKHLPSIVVAEKDVRFFGHGVFSLDGKLIFASQYNDRERRGVVGVYDSDSGKKLSQLDAHGTFPHDCQLDSQGRLLVICRRGTEEGQSNANLLNWIDPKSGKLVDSLELKPKSKTPSTLYHFQQQASGWIVASGAAERNPTAHPGCVLAINLNDPNRKAIEIPSGLPGHIGESLSLAEVGSSGTIAAISSPSGNSVFLWNFKENKVIDEIVVEAARGLVSLDPEKLLISSGSKRTLLEYNLKRKSVKQYEWLNGLWGNGAHLHTFRIKGPIKRRV